VTLSFSEVCIPLHAESLAAVRAEEADDLAARLAEARKQLHETGASYPGSPQSQPAVSPPTEDVQARHWLPRAASDAAASAMHPNTRLRNAQVQPASLLLEQAVVYSADFTLSVHSQLDAPVQGHAYIRGSYRPSAERSKHLK
jgi:hypothetical protein